MVPNASEDLPEPDTPVNTASALRGMATSTSRRLFSRAPRTRTQWSDACGLLPFVLMECIRPTRSRPLPSCAVTTSNGTNKPLHRPRRRAGRDEVLGPPAQERGRHALRCLERRPMRNVLQRRERCVREPVADALGHVRTGDRVEHSPDETQRYVGRLEYVRPALGVLPAVLD